MKTISRSLRFPAVTHTECSCTMFDFHMVKQGRKRRDDNEYGDDCEMWRHLLPEALVFVT